MTKGVAIVKIIKRNLEDLPSLICTMCGHNFVADYVKEVSEGFEITKQLWKIHEDNFYPSGGEMFKGNGGRISICVHCANKMFQEYIEHYHSREVALYWLCAKFEWYYNKELFEKITGSDNLFLKKYIAASMKYPNADKGFRDSEVIQENSVDNLPEDQREEVRKFNKKWVGSYTDSEIAYLEDYYAKLLKEFPIVTENHRDYARKLSRASLYADLKFDEMMNGGGKDAEAAYGKAQAVFDKFSKSAQFAEATRQTVDSVLGSFSRIVELVENDRYIYKHTPLEKDDIDLLLENKEHIKKSL